jgi:hypothetical protein
MTHFLCFKRAGNFPAQVKQRSLFHLGGKFRAGIEQRLPVPYKFGPRIHSIQSATRRDPLFITLLPGKKNLFSLSLSPSRSLSLSLSPCPPISLSLFLSFSLSLSLFLSLSFALALSLSLSFALALSLSPYALLRCYFFSCCKKYFCTVILPDFLFVSLSFLYLLYCIPFLNRIFIPSVSLSLSVCGHSFFAAFFLEC